MHPFHLAIPVNDLKEAAHFYENILGCKRGRSSTHCVDYNFFGHQVVCHLSQQEKKLAHNPVDGDEVPVPHFGVVLDMQSWSDLVENLKRHEIAFIIEPRIRFKGLAGEQATCFFRDPSGNALEFKAFANLDRLFATD